jgi:acetolactate synthase I/II/III large subunit
MASSDRRHFLKGAAASAAAMVANAAVGEAQQAPAPAPAAPAAAPSAEDRVIEHPGSDFMIDVVRALGLEFCTTNPGSTFEGIHESLINYGENRNPELLTCCHEESAVAMAHGFAKIEGKPMMALLHGTVGLQHAAMAIYNAYADRVPIYIVVGNHRDAGSRPNGVQWYHAAQDMAALVRDYIKWDDDPGSLGHFAESAIRAYKIAMTPPMGPVVLVVDSELQKKALPQHSIAMPKLTMPSPPAGDPVAVKEAARMLVAADNPLIVATRAARTPNGMTLVVELAELLQAPVQGGGERVNIPSRHPLAGGAIGQPDVILNLEVQGVAAPANPRAKVITISALDLFIKSNIQDFQHMPNADLAIAGDSEATLPLLIEEVRRAITPDRRRLFQERGAKLAEAHAKTRREGIEAAAYGWDASPISLGRLSAELWNQIKNDDWSLVSWQGFISGWPGRLWNFDKHYRYIGGQGAGGMGYGAPAAVGAALANKKHGRLSINIQTDGDLNYAPGVLWTAAHHRIPLLTLMHNNRAYHQEVMFIEQMASERNRGADRAHIGTTITDPNIDYAKMAQAYGMYGEGPITNPADLGPAIARGLERVRRGEPALIDVVTQPR